MAVRNFRDERLLFYKDGITEVNGLVFRMVQGPTHRVGTLWVGLLYLASQSKSHEGESIK